MRKYNEFKILRNLREKYLDNLYNYDIEKIEFKDASLVVDFYEYTPCYEKSKLYSIKYFIVNDEVFHEYEEYVEVNMLIADKGMREKILNSLKEDDVNGCYTDEQTSLEGIQKINSKDALIHFIFSNYADHFDFDIFNNSLEYTLDKMINLNLYHNLVTKLILLRDSRSFKNV